MAKIFLEEVIDRFSTEKVGGRAGVVESSLMENSCNLLYEQSPYLFYKDQLLKRNLGYNIMESESNPIYTFYTSWFYYYTPFIQL